MCIPSSLQLSIEIGHEVKTQNKLLSEMVSGYVFKKFDLIFANNKISTFIHFEIDTEILSP